MKAITRTGKVLVALCFAVIISAGGDVEFAKVTLKDGFEDGGLARFWRPGDSGSGRYVPEAVSFTSQYHRLGDHCVRLTLKEGYIRQNGGDGHFTERTELDAGKHAFLYQEVWYRYSLLIPGQFPIIDNRLVLSQMKQSGFSTGPLVAQRFRNGRHYLTVRDLTDETRKQQKFELPELKKEKWHDFVFQIRYSDKQDGYVNMWMNGKQVVSFAGKTAHENGENRFYHKIGLYRDQWPDPMVVYFDDYLLTNDTSVMNKSLITEKN